jgi:hypothetical protein
MKEKFKLFSNGNKNMFFRLNLSTPQRPGCIKISRATLKGVSYEIYRFLVWHVSWIGLDQNIPDGF